MTTTTKMFFMVVSLAGISGLAQSLSAETGQERGVVEGRAEKVAFTPEERYGRPTGLGDETRATEHAVAHGAWSQHGRMPFPVHHVLAGHMGEFDPVIVVYVVQMIAAFPIERAIWIAGKCLPGSRVRQMIGHPRIRRVLRPSRGLDNRLWDLRNAHCGNQRHEEECSECFHEFHIGVSIGESVRLFFVSICGTLSTPPSIANTCDILACLAQHLSPWNRLPQSETSKEASLPQQAQNILM
jgi:hypothetical protein